MRSGQHHPVEQGLEQYRNEPPCNVLLRRRTVSARCVNLLMILMVGHLQPQLTVDSEDSSDDYDQIS